MTTKYQIFFIYSEKLDLIDTLEKEIKFEVTNNFLIESLVITHNNIDSKDVDKLCIAVYFGSRTWMKNQQCSDLINSAIDIGLCTIPVIRNADEFYNEVPEELHSINAFIWEGNIPERKLTKRILENLGLNEKERRVFISYRRVDGLGVANQLHDLLSRRRFNVFLDKYDIDIGRDVQQEIYEAIEKNAFLIVLETQRAHESIWVKDEIIFALERNITVLMLTWPNVKPLMEGIEDLTHIYLSQNDLILNNNTFQITNKKIDNLLDEIESIHADGLLLRRKQLIMNIEDDLKLEYEICHYVDNWVLLFRNHKVNSSNLLISITPRLPTAPDLYFLDKCSRNLIDNDNLNKILFHQIDLLKDDYQKLLNWILKEKIDIKICKYDI